MNTAASDLEREDRLDAIIASYLKGVQDGSAPPRQALLDSHPDLASDLAEFFADQDRIGRIAAPLRDGSAPELRSLTLPARQRDFGDYEILEEIARGSMGVVFKARQKSLNRTVALKMLLAGPLASADDLRRFQAEAEAAARLEHPNIVPIYDVGVQESCPYLSMKLLQGGSLAQAAGRPANPRDAARLTASIADAVHFAHQRGVLHRDLKPANILLDERGQPYVTDFGLAKQVQRETLVALPADSDAGRSVAHAPTRTGAVVGTPAYMAPEQARGDRDAVTVVSDVYGLGAVLYELLTGKAPFRGATALDTLRMVLEADPQRPRALNPTVDRDLETICLKCLAKEPARRYASAADLAADLRRYLAGQPILARRAGRVERLARSIRRHPVVSVLVAALVITLAAGLAVSTALWLRAELNETRLADALQSAQQAKAKAQGETLRADQNAQEAEARRLKVDADFRQAHESIKRIRQQCDELGKVSGTQPVRRQLLQTVLDYEEEFVRQRGDDPALRRERADAQFDCALIISQIGTNAECLAAYRRAGELYRELHEADPQDVSLQRCYVNCFNNAGVHETDVESRRADFQEARRLYEEFLCFHPDDESLLNGLGGALDNLGSSYLNSGRFHEAMTCFKQSIEIQEELFHRDEHRIAFTNDLAVTYSNLAVLYTRLPGHFDDARTYYDKSRDLYGRLAQAFPADAVRQANYAAALNSLGILYRDNGDNDKALGFLLDAQKVRQKVADENPSVGRFQVDLAVSISNVGVAYARKGDRDKSLACHAQARDILDNLYKQDPKSKWARKYLAVEWYNIGAGNGALNRWLNEANAEARARALQEPLLAEDPNDFDCRCDLGRTTCDLGFALFKMNRPDDAREALLAGIASLKEGMERSPEAADSLRWLLNGHYVNLSLTERGAGRPDQAVAVTLERLKQCGPDGDEYYRGALELAAALPLYGGGKAEPSADEQAGRDRCTRLTLEALRQAAARGFHDANRVRKDREFDPLRSREDFQAAVADIEKNDKKPPAGTKDGAPPAP